MLPLRPESHRIRIYDFAQRIPMPRMREQAARDKPVAAVISLSVKASSFGAISRLNRASSPGPGARASRRLTYFVDTYIRFVRALLGWLAIRGYANYVGRG